MLKDSPIKLSGNERFEGFGIDLIHELSLMLGFNYTFILQEDGVYGSLNRDTKKWNGMVQELLEWVSARVTVSAAKCHEHHKIFTNENNKHIRGGLMLIGDTQ